MTYTTLFTFRGITMSAEVLNYVYEVVDDHLTDEVIARRIWEKANPYVHISDFPREELRQVLRQITGRSEYRKIMHHIHMHRNVQDMAAIAEFARALYAAVNARLNARL